MTGVKGDAFLMSSLYPIKTKLLTPNSYSRSQDKLKAMKGVVIHWTANEGAGANADANRNFFESRKSGTLGYGGAHYIIDDQQIILCIPEDEMAYHVGGTTYRTNYFGSYPNNCLIGIEMCVNSDGDFSKVYQQTVLLTVDLVKRYKLDIDKDIVRHYDITGKNCPGYFTSDHWGVTNNSYAVKYGLGSNADAAWHQFLQDVKDALVGEAIKLFTDTLNHWAKNDIEALAKMGIIHGRSDGTFDPDAPITRAEVAVIAHNVVTYITGK
jgi:N-acetylmuramoyl-L-alanine amidase